MLSMMQDLRMSEFQNKKMPNPEKQVPGCLGRMANLFYLNAGVARNRLLTNKPHCDDLSLARTQSDVARILSPIEDQIEDELKVSELRRNSSNGKLNGTPIKMLVAHEMSKEVASKNNSSNVVAKLMGLEALPQGHSELAVHRIQSKGYSQNTQSHSGVPLKNEVHSRGHDEYKDVYEIKKQSEQINFVRDLSPQEMCDIDNPSEKKMTLIRQKFIEAKRLSTDEKLRQSEEFQDALEILNSNKELFLKVLQEPNSIFTKHLYNVQSSLPPPRARRITVLRPKIVDKDVVPILGKNNDKQTSKLVQMDQSNGCNKINARIPSWKADDSQANGCNKINPPFPSWKADDNPSPSQATRIVVLKPGPWKTHDIKAASPASSSPRMSNGGNSCSNLGDDEVLREASKDINENLSGHRRDETLLSSVFSNGYIGDESSFRLSENEREEGNLSDSDFMSPSFRQSWNHINNKFGSPCSSSSFGRASYSPESSVCREAKKRLSERWAMMASNGSYQEHWHARKSSSTLGEMLALSDTRKSLRADEGTSMGPELRGSPLSLNSNLIKDEGLDNSPRNLLRSKSVPVSSTVYGPRLNVQVPDSDVCKMHVSEGLSKAKSGKSSLKGKVSNLFFSKNRKSIKDKSSKCPSNGECSSNQSHNFVGEKSMPRPLDESTSKASSSNLIGSQPRQAMFSCESVSHGAKSKSRGIQNQDQPSPVSVFEVPFEEDDSTTPESSSSSKQDQRGLQVSGGYPDRSSMIGKSPLIEPMARRTLLWNDYTAQIATPRILMQHSSSPRAEDVEEDWRSLVQTLLSAAGIDGEVQCHTFFARWHSLESPLSPSLRETYVSHVDKECMFEAKRRLRRSNRKLVFDCVNAALVDLTGQESGTGLSLRTRLCNEGSGDASSSSSLLLSPVLANRVCSRMKEWCSAEGATAEDSLNRSSLVVDRVVGGEWVGGWIKREADGVGQVIGRELLEDLLSEAVVDFTRIG